MKAPVKKNQVAKFDARSAARGLMRNDCGDGDGPSEPAMDHPGTRCVTPRITVAEERVLRWVAQAKTNKEIAAALGISPATVKRHLEKILSKLGLRNRVELAIYGLTANSCPHHSISGCALGRFERESEHSR